MPAKPHFVGSKLTSKERDRRKRERFILYANAISRLLIAKTKCYPPNCPLLLHKQHFFFPHSIKMPQGPPGPLAVTFPDRLPYGESNVPDAFSCTRFPAA